MSNKNTKAKETKVEKEKKSGRNDGKVTFIAYNKSGSGKNESFELNGEKFASKGPGAAAKKAISSKAKKDNIANGEEMFAHIRKAGTSKIREYKGCVVPDLTVEPNSELNRRVGTRSVIEKYDGTEEEFVKRNEYYKTHPMSPKASKVAGKPTAWSEEERDARNAKFIEVDLNGEKVQTLELLPGEHVVLKAKKSTAKFIRTFQMPEGTLKQKPGEPKEESEEEKAGETAEPEEVKTEEVVEEVKPEEIAEGEIDSETVTEE